MLKQEILELRSCIHLTLEFRQKPGLEMASKELGF